MQSQEERDEALRREVAESIAESLKSQLTSAKWLAKTAIAYAEEKNPHSGGGKQFVIDEDGEFYVEWWEYDRCGGQEHHSETFTIEQLIEFAIKKHREDE